MFNLPASSTTSRLLSSALQSRVDQTRLRALFERLSLSMSVGLLTAVGIVFTLDQAVPRDHLLAWLTARMVISLSRAGHAWSFHRSNDTSAWHWYPVYVLLAALDGLAWGALGWALTPVQHMEIAVVSIGVLIGVAALGVFMLHVDFLAAALFITPILLPNVFYALSRHDSVGVFGAVAITGLMVMLVAEARRSNRRILELLRLRFQSEQVAHAQAEALRQAQLLGEAKSRFVATMSHEMRTPLHGILGLARLLRQRACDAESAHQLELMRGSGEHLLHVINDVLDFSRMEAGALPLHEQAFDLHALVNEVAETSAVSAGEKGLTLSVALDIGGGQEVLGDPVRVRQILHNLLGNAVKFTQQGHVGLRAWRDARTGMVTMAVEDTGIGIEPAELIRVFEAFHQAEGTYQRRFGGAGLGLTISRELCRAMGGDLVCRSQPGSGSVFTFTLPLPLVSPLVSPQPSPKASIVPASDAARPVHVVLRQNDGPPHVLLVEDNQVNALVAEAELQRLGVMVTVVSHGRAAVEWLDEGRADLVLMDCEMPELDGFEATRMIRQREQAAARAPVSIVALTANGELACRDRCLDVGMNGHLAKPFRSDELMRTLARHLPGLQVTAQATAEVSPPMPAERDGSSAPPEAPTAVNTSRPVRGLSLQH